MSLLRARKYRGARLACGRSPAHERDYSALARAAAAALRRFSHDAQRRAAHRGRRGGATKAEQRLRLVANNVPALISYVDRHQRYRFSNRTYDDWLGIAHERMLGRTVAEVFGEDAYARMRPEIERCMAGAAVEFEFATAEGGKRRTLQVACVPHLGRESEVLGFYMLANDVTALKRAQEDLRFVAAQLSTTPNAWSSLPITTR